MRQLSHVSLDFVSTTRGTADRASRRTRHRSRLKAGPQRELLAKFGALWPDRCGRRPSPRPRLAYRSHQQWVVAAEAIKSCARNEEARACRQITSRYQQRRAP